MRKLLLSLFAIVLVIAVASLGVDAGPYAFKAKLTGKDDGVKTSARGEAVFKLEKSDTELVYTLDVKGIENVTAAHIHYGMKGKEGGPVVNLYTGPKKEGKFSGELSKGTITEKDLYGALQGKKIDDVVKMIKERKLYINVHTDRHPSGEIRGQIS